MSLLDRFLAMARMFLKGACVGGLVGIIAGLIVGSILWVGIEWPRGLSHGDIMLLWTILGALFGFKVGCLVTLFRLFLHKS